METDKGHRLDAPGPPSGIWGLQLRTVSYRYREGGKCPSWSRESAETMLM